MWINLLLGRRGHEREPAMRGVNEARCTSTTEQRQRRSLVSFFFFFANWPVGAMLAGRKRGQWVVEEGAGGGEFGLPIPTTARVNNG